MGGDPSTISGLSGIGDLMLTCFGDLSRNRTCGIRLAKVMSMIGVWIYNFDATSNITRESL